jgi:hypothetical protein
VLARGPWAGYGRGWMNNPGSLSARTPRLTRRFSLDRIFSVFLATIGRSRATHRSRARRGAAEVGEGVRDLLVRGVVREHWRRDRFCGGLVVLPGE